MSLYTELKRRNVFKVGIVYLGVAWLLLQVSDTLGPALHLPEWFISAVVFLLILGFPVALVFAWAFDLTPDGLKLETGNNNDPSMPFAKTTGKNVGFLVVAALGIALSYFVFDKFVLDSDRNTAEISTGDQLASQPPADVGSPGIENSIAVLPFVNMSSDEEQDYFSDGLSEQLLNLLAKIPELNVAARTSSFSFKDKSLEIPEIASRLKVAYVLEGSVRKQENRLRITAQLIQANNGYHLWSETYDRQMDNVFQIQDEIASEVVGALSITLLGVVPKTRKTDPVTYQLFLEGQYLKRQLSRDSLNRAIEVLNQAVEIDPAYVPAWAELADTYIWGGGSDKWSPAERRALAEAAIQTAISNDPDYAFSYYVRGISWIFNKLDFKRGIEDFQHALELDPDDAFLVAAIGKGAFLTGQYDLAISQYKAALAMEPLVPEFYYFLGGAYLSSGRLDDAEASYRTLDRLNPSSRSKAGISRTLFLKGEFEAALAEYDSSFTRAITHHALGNLAEADAALKELIEHSKPSTVADAYGYRGDVDETFAWLAKAQKTDDYLPSRILISPAYRSVYSDPRWEIHLEQLGLLEYWRAMTPDSDH